MFRSVGLTALALTIAAPAAAADLRATHEPISTPPGKLHSIAFRPLKPKACAVEAPNPSGSRIQALRASDPGCDAVARARAAQ